jgi:hypothetical protein
MLILMERWSSHIMEWSLYYYVDQIANFGKTMLVHYNYVSCMNPIEF